MKTRTTISITAVVGAIAVVFAAGIYLNAQGAPQLQADFTNAAVAEVRDAQGAVVLRGDFVRNDEDDDDIERKAALKAAGPDTDAAGEAEVEFPKTNVVVQEVEFSVKNLTPGATYAFVIDGKTVTTAKTGKDGSASVDVDVKMPAGGVQ